MMQDLREKTKIIMIVVALAFVGLMVFEWGMDISGQSAGLQTGELGRVNGEPIPYDAWMATYQQMSFQAQQSGRRLSREEVRQLEDAAFEQTVNDMLLRQELQRRGIRASDAEIRQAALWTPHPDLMQNEIFQTDGQFDIQRYHDFLNSPSASDDLLLQLEMYYREAIPRNKLVRQVAAGTWISDSELWRMWQDQNETVATEYVILNISQLVPGDVEVTEREVRTYYNENRESFRQPASAVFNVAVISKMATRADSLASLERAHEVRAELLEGADFGEVAMRESADPGSAQNGGELGTFGRGQMVPGFEQVAFSLPVGEISEPVETPFGFHIIQVQAREGEQVTARHILIPIEPSDASVDEMFARVDSLEALAERGGFQRGARAVDAEVRSGVRATLTDPYVPGIGSMFDAIEWAMEEAEEGTGVTVSPTFETEEAFYLVEVERFSPAGILSLEAATPQIQRQLILEKKREQARQIGQQMVAEVRAGKPLAEAAQERGLQLQTTAAFTRTGFNPVFGQANAAIGAAFGTPVGQVSDVVSTSAGLFIIRPTERTEADRAEFEEQKNQLREAMLYQAQQQQVTRFMESLRRDARIDDRRDEMLVRSASL